MGPGSEELVALPATSTQVGSLRTTCTEALKFMLLPCRPIMFHVPLKFVWWAGCVRTRRSGQLRWRQFVVGAVLEDSHTAALPPDLRLPPLVASTGETFVPQRTDCMVVRLPRKAQGRQGKSSPTCNVPYQPTPNHIGQLVLISPVLLLTLSSDRPLSAPLAFTGSRAPLLLMQTRESYRKTYCCSMAVAQASIFQHRYRITT